ncbi:MAG: AAA family ATPase [Kiritimatiellales bacterium]|jgi:hypothetical protein
MLPRNIKDKINRSLESFPVVVLIGSRQSGKTTLARKVRPDWRYFDLEKGSDLDFITRDFDFFFKQYPEALIIDEAQASPDLFRELRGVIDTDRARKGRFLLTGSSSPELAKNIAESLAGRVAVVEIGTLKMNERYRQPLPPVYSILNGSPTEKYLEELQRIPLTLDTAQVMNHFLKGGYPEPAVEDSDAFRAEWMTNYQQTYIQRDVRRLFPGLNTENYRRFITMLSELSGTILNRSEIGRSLNASEAAVRDYLDIAQGTFIWRTLPSLERTVSKSVVKMPRGYLRDSGLLHHLLNIRQTEQIYTRSGTGAAFEGFMIEEIIQGLSAVETAPWSFNFYRTRGGAEVDLIMTSPLGIRIPVEIKFGATTRRDDLRSLIGFIEQEKCPCGIVINNADEIRLLTEQIIQLPAGCF